MTNLRKALPYLLLACAALMALPLAAQTPPDCSFTFNFTGDATQTAQSNLSGNTPCVNWRVTFSTTGALATTVTFQTSPDNSSWTSVPNTVCSSSAQPPCMLQGTNPLTGTAQGMAYFSSYGNYVRVITSGSSGTGTGTVRGYGAKGASAGALPGGGGGGTVTNTGGALTANAVILGAGGADVKAGAVLPSDATRFYNGAGGFTIPGGSTPSGFYLKSGSSYYVGPTFQPATLPVGASFSWVNQGTATETATGNALVLATPITGRNWISRVQSIGANATLTAAITCTIEPLQYRTCAVLFRESATSKLIVFGMGYNGGMTVLVQRFSDNVTYASTASQGNFGQQVPLWVRLAISGNNLNFSMSSDGITFVTIWSETKTTFFTTGPDQWGYGLNCENNQAGQSSPCSNTLLSWAIQ